MPTDYFEAAVTALADLAATTQTDPEAALVNAVADAARRSGLTPSEAPHHPRDFPPKSVVRDLVRRAETTLDAETMHRRATGQH